MMRSRTSTAYMAPPVSLLGIADDGGERPRFGGERLRQGARRRFKGDVFGHQGVKRRRGQKPERGLQAAPEAPARPPAGRNLSDLGGQDPQAAAVKGTTELDGCWPVAIPAEFNDGCLEAGTADGGIEAGAGGAGVE